MSWSKILDFVPVGHPIRAKRIRNKRLFAQTALGAIAKGEKNIKCPFCGISTYTFVTLLQKWVFSTEGTREHILEHIHSPYSLKHENHLQ